MASKMIILTLVLLFSIGISQLQPIRGLTIGTFFDYQDKVSIVELNGAIYDYHIAANTTSITSYYF